MTRALEQFLCEPDSGAGLYFGFDSLDSAGVSAMTDTAVGAGDAAAAAAAEDAPQRSGSSDQTTGEVPAVETHPPPAHSSQQPGSSIGDGCQVSPLSQVLQPLSSSSGPLHVRVQAARR